MSFSTFKFQKAHKIIHLFFHIEWHMKSWQCREKGTWTSDSHSIPGKGSVHEKPLAHQTLLMILQKVWWFVQNPENFSWTLQWAVLKLKLWSAFYHCYSACNTIKKKKDLKNKNMSASGSVDQLIRDQTGLTTKILSTLFNNFHDYLQEAETEGVCQYSGLTNLIAIIGTHTHQGGPCVIVAWPG